VLPFVWLSSLGFASRVILSRSRLFGLWLGDNSDIVNGKMSTSIIFEHKTTVFERGHDRYVFRSQCEQVFYSNVPGERDWSFVVRYDPIGRPVKYTHLQEEDDIEDQEDDSTDQTEPKDHGGSTDEEDKEDHDLGVGDNIVVLNDDVDENTLKNDIDDGDDIINPFNIVSKIDDDTDVEFNEEDQDIE
jgi:hypothetical protein